MVGFDGVILWIYDESRCGTWQETPRGRSPRPCGTSLPRRKGCCDFAYSPVISGNLCEPFTLGKKAAHGTLTDTQRDMSSLSHSVLRFLPLFSLQSAWHVHSTSPFSQPLLLLMRQRHAIISGAFTEFHLLISTSSPGPLILCQRALDGFPVFEAQLWLKRCFQLPKILWLWLCDWLCCERGWMS